MRPVLFELFGFPIRAYGLFIGVGFMLGLWLAKRVASRRRPDYVHLIDDFATIALVSSILGARIWEVAFSWDYYGKNLAEIPAIWHGGLSIQGAIVGGVMAALWFAHSRRLRFWDLADVLTPGLVLGQAVGRIGSCFLNGDAYGKPTDSIFGVVYAPGSPAYETFGPVPLWPAELFEGMWDLAILAIALRLLRKERPEGTVFLLYVVLYSIGRFSLEFLRADSLHVGTLKAAQITSVLFALAAGALLLRLHLRRAASSSSSS